jgi:hypothetical protein
MLPLLPAILLLLLQGPSNVERLAARGRLPSAFDAVCRSVGDTPTLREAEQVVFATLLAAGEDPRLSDALFAILRTRRVQRAAPVVASAEVPRVRPAVGAVPTVRDGFARSQRTRDGPLSIA